MSAICCNAPPARNSTSPGLLSDTGSDDPPFSDELKNVLARALHNIVIGNILSPPGPGALGAMFRFLPPEIRDHLQDSYWKALTRSRKSRVLRLPALRIGIELRRLAAVEHAVVAHHADAAKPRAVLQ
jgi:hypothetical protein